MREEVNSAIDFIAHLVAGGRFGSTTVDTFRQEMHNVLCSHYQDHWFPEKPFKGSGYRCMRIVNQKMDPLIAKAGAGCGLTERDLLKVLPSELTMWVDPEEVSYRIGEDGSIGVLYNATEATYSGNPFDLPPSPSGSSASDSDNLSSSSSSSSPSPSPDIIHSSCKDQARSYFPSAPQDQLSIDRYFAQYVAS